MSLRDQFLSGQMGGGGGSPASQPERQPSSGSLRDQFLSGAVPGQPQPELPQPSTPGYWERPEAIARGYFALQSLPPGSPAPDWMNAGAIQAAWDYMSQVNRGAPWWEWDTLGPTDPALQYLRQIAAPPADALLPGEERWAQELAKIETPAASQATGYQPGQISPTLTTFGLTGEQYDALPLWQRAMLPLFSNPATQGGATGALFGALNAGPAGALVGGALGAGLTKAAAAQQAEVDKKIAAGLLPEGSQPGLVKLLLALDYPAEWLERAIGVAYLGWDRSIEGFQEGGLAGGWKNAVELIANLDDAYRAAHLFYESLPVGRSSSTLGVAQSQQLRPDQMGADALYEAFTRLRGGESVQAIYDEYAQRYGFEGQMREMFGHFLLDPLNLTGFVGNEALILAGKAAGNDTLQLAGKAMRSSPLEIATGRGKGLVDTAQMYGALLKKTKSVDEISHMDAFSRWLGGVTKAGGATPLERFWSGGVTKGGAVVGLEKVEPTRFNRLGGAAVLGIPGAALGFAVGGPVGAAALGGLGGLAGYNRFLTPAARATEINNNAILDLAMLLEKAGDDEATMVRYVKSLGQTPVDLARELSMSALDAPEGAALPHMFRDYGPKADALLQSYNRHGLQRQLLANLAGVTGRSVDDVLREIDDAGDGAVLLRQYREAAAGAGETGAEIVRAIDAGEIKPETLRGMVKAFVDGTVPYSSEHFRAQLYASMIEHGAGWSAKWFGVQPDPSLVRLGKTVKSAQSLALLGLNPGYLINNALNNVVTMAYTGVLGLRGKGQIADFWARMGVMPERLRQGLGMAGDELAEAVQSANAGRVRSAAEIESAGRSKANESVKKAGAAGDNLERAERMFRKAGSKLGIFSRLSGEVESWSSAQAFTSGTMQAFSRLWRPGKGFDPLPLPLQRALGPELSSFVHQAIAGGANAGEIEAALFSGVTRKGLDAFIPDAARQVGMSEADLKSALTEVGAYDFLQARLRASDSDEAVRLAFDDMRDLVERRLSELTRSELVGQAEQARARVAAEGIQAALDIYDRIEQAETERWIRNFDEWEAVFARTADMEAARRSAQIRRQFKLEDQAWTRLWDDKKASYLGIANALGIESGQSQAFIGRLAAGVDNWESFHRAKREKLQRFFGAIFDTRERRNAAWQTLQEELDQLYAAHSATEIRLQTEMDGIFTGLFEAQFGAGKAAGAVEWRRGVREIREGMQRDMRAFRQSLQGKTPAQRRAAWSEFLNGTYKRSIVERMQANVEGARRMADIAAGRAQPDPVNPAEVAAAPLIEPLPRMPDQPGQLALITDQATGQTSVLYPPYVRTQADRVRYIARQQDVFADRHIVNAVNRYAGTTYRKVNEISEADALRAFDERARAHAGQPAAAAADQVENIQAHADDWQAVVDGPGRRPEPAPEAPEPGPVEPAAVPEAVQPVDPPAAALPLGTIEGLDPTPPIRRITEEAWADTLWPALEEIGERLAGPEGRLPQALDGQALAPEVMQGLRDYAERVKGQLADVKLAAVRYGESRRDLALLNYSRRYEWDNIVGSVLPYHFWYTRSAINWALRALDRPALMANYARLRAMQDQVVSMPGFPTRLKGKLQIPVPFLPDWAGGHLYIDPYKQLFPWEQIAAPFERNRETQSQLLQRAVYKLEDMLAQETITLLQAQEAVRTKAGPLWEKALTQAKMEIEGEVSNPMDFISLLSGPMLPLQWAYKYAMGQQDEIGLLPASRFIQSLTSLANIGPAGGWNPEAKLREALGLKSGGPYWDYAVDKALSDMAATGEISVEDAKRAMIDRSGEVWELAAARAGDIQAAQGLGGPVGLGLFPEGEQVQRTLQQTLRGAYQAQDAGQEGVVSAFYDAHPEYSVRQMSFEDDPDVRLKKYLSQSVLDAFFNLPDLHQKQARGQLGPAFEDYLNKETRSLDAVDSETLAMWAQALGYQLPETVEAPQMGVEFAGQVETDAYQQMKDEQRNLYADGLALQETYYSLPEGAMREMFLQQNPRLGEMWDWRDAYLADHPELIQYAISEESELYGVDPEIAAAVYGFKAERAQRFGRDIFDVQDGYFDLQTKREKAAYLKQHPELTQYWDWQKVAMAQNPAIIPYIKGDQSIANAVLGQGWEDTYSLENVDLASFPPALVGQLTGAFLAGGKLSTGARAELRRIWERSGRPGGDLDTFIELLRQNVGAF
jgi:hypothetical protein